MGSGRLDCGPVLPERAHRKCSLDGRSGASPAAPLESGGMRISDSTIGGDRNHLENGRDNIVLF